MYSTDFRKLALRLYKQFKSYRKVAEIMNISTSTIHRWKTKGIEKSPKRQKICKMFEKTRQFIESFTTKICSCCKCEKQPVYLDCHNRIFASKTRKQVPEQLKEQMGRIMDAIKLKDIVRKGGGFDAKIEERDFSKKMYYPEVRGLRFCPKCRKFLNRDKESAKSIGLLHMLRTTRNERPSCFCKKSKGASVDVSPMKPFLRGGAYVHRV